MLRCLFRSTLLLSVALVVPTTNLPIFVPAMAAQSQSSAATLEAKKHYQNAVAAIAKNDWQKAKSELLQAEKLAPKNALVHYDLALAYSHTGSPKSARAEIDKALQLGLPAEQKQAAEQLKSDLGNPAAALSVQNSEQHVEGPSLEETLRFLDRLISEGAVEENGRSSREKRWQNMVVAGYPTMQCLIGWGEVSRFWIARAQGSPVDKQDGTRRYVSLRDLYITELRVMDLKSYVETDRFTQGFQHDDGDTFSGYVVVIQHDKMVFGRDLNPIVAGVKGLVVDPPTSMQVGPADHLYFTTESDAERAKKALAHAAVLCGAKADPF